MKKFLLYSLIAVSAVACNTSLDEKATVGSKQAVQPVTSDTTGLAAYNAWKAQNELATTQNAQQTEAVASAPRVRTVVKEVPVYIARKRSSSSSNNTGTSNNTENTANSNTGSESANSGSTATSEKKKEGWSKAAKGAVIGGVAGAAGGAVINKKNRAAGAVIGGIIGAAGGYGIGRTMDKKDGRIDYNPY